MHKRRCGEFFQSFPKSFSRDFSCPVPYGSSMMPCSLLSKCGTRPLRLGGSFSRAWGGTLASSSTVGHAPWSAAPPAGLRGLLPKLHCSIVSIFMGVQGWDLATWNKKEAKAEFLFTSEHHTQIKTEPQQLHEWLCCTESGVASGVTLPPSLPPFYFLPLSLC